MNLENLATSAVEMEISKTDRLSTFIKNGDREPCWDGHIYIHEDSQHTKKNLKKVAAQVKGKAVSPKAVKRAISYPVSYDDLYSYMINGGTVFFVVYIDRDSGDILQIYCKGLLPFTIKELLKVKKGKYSIKFNKFPPEKIKKTELFINFYEDSKKQASFAALEPPTIEALSKAGVLEGLSICYTSLEPQTGILGIPKKLSETGLTMYANIKGCTAPIPVEYFDGIDKVTMSRIDKVPITVNGVEFYSECRTVITKDFIERRIGSSTKLKAPNSNGNTPKDFGTFSFHLKGTLSERIAAIEFISAVLENGSFCLGNSVIPINFNADDLVKMKSNNSPRILEGYKRAKTVLNSMNVKKDLDADKCSQKDIDNINLLIGAIGDKLPVKNNPGKPANIQRMTIANLALGVVYIERENGDYNLYDYFGEHLNAAWSPDGANHQRVSQFFSMTADDFLSLDNLNLDFVVEDFKIVPPSDLHIELCNATMLNMLKAYDKKSSAKLLDAASQLCTWMQGYPEYISANITTLNQLQIVRRERELSFQEKVQLTDIVTSENEPAIKIGALLLLDEQHEVNSLLKTLTEEQCKQIQEYPIYRFYRNDEGRTV